MVIHTPPAPALPPEIDDIVIGPHAPLIIVDVDEVLAMFMRGFERYVTERGLEMRLERFALFQNIYRPGASEHLDVAEGRALFEAFFETDVEAIEPAPGAAAALRELSSLAEIVVLTNAPAHSREARGRWLRDNGFPYPLILNSGLKGPAVAVLAARTSGPTAFVDDLLPNLDSVAEDAPKVRRFQMVADERLRPLAWTAPDRHVRLDTWSDLRKALATVVAPSGQDR
jgi:hypothetical protein